MVIEVSASQVVAFRLAAHHLARRLPGDGLLEAAGRCGVQNSPPGSALLALNARVRGVSVEQMAGAVAEDRTLLQTWCMRGAPYFFPTIDAPVFTTGVLPPTEEAMRHFVPGVAPALDRLGLRLTEAVALCAAEIETVLSGRRLAIGELGEEVAGRVARGLTPSQRRLWAGEGPYAPGQPLGEGVVHFCLRILTLQGVVCFAPRTGNQAPFVLVREWLGRPIADVDPDLARAELLRRYLRGYGPSTPADFAAWLGVRSADTRAWWSLVEEELTRIEYAGPAWILTGDLEALRSTPRPRGARLLPPRDPYTQLRDRETILAKEHHRQLWRTVGEPGTVLVDGEVAGTWRPRKAGTRLTITISPFGPVPTRAASLLRGEAEQVATLRGASSADVRLDTP